MALPGMKSTADFAADERPKNWREGILKLAPRSGASLFGLTSMMSSERTDDPEFYWWEEPLNMYIFYLTAGLDNTAGVDTITINSGGTKLKPGDLLKVSVSGEQLRVLSIISDTSVSVERARGQAATPAGTATATTVGINDDRKLVYVGSAYREGAPRSVGTSFAPAKKSNITQIFRDPIEMTRTAMQTKTRTGDPWKNDRERIAHKHSLGIERALWFGSRFETMESGQPIRTTDGVLAFIPPENVKIAGNSGIMDMDELESYFESMFAFGSKEKLVFCSVRIMTILTAIVRKNTQYQWGKNEKEYGMDVRRFYTPAGTLVLTEHPMFSSMEGYMNEDMVVIDTSNLKYRHIQDTTIRKEIQENGVDGKADEFLTECGLEVHHGKTHFWLRGIKGAQTDD